MPLSVFMSSTVFMAYLAYQVNQVWGIASITLAVVSNGLFLGFTNHAKDGLKNLVLILAVFSILNFTPVLLISYILSGTANETPQPKSDINIEKIKKKVQEIEVSFKELKKRTKEGTQDLSAILGALMTCFLMCGTKSTNLVSRC
jgi:hypothetical protein